jgi:hypothetical protein
MGGYMEKLATHQLKSVSGGLNIGKFFGKSLGVGSEHRLDKIVDDDFGARALIDGNFWARQFVADDNSGQLVRREALDLIPKPARRKEGWLYALA